MQVHEPRQATGTPIRQLFEDADRMAALEEQNRRLWAAIGDATLVILRLQAQVDAIGHNDSRLSAILGSIQSEIKTLREGTELLP